MTDEESEAPGDGATGDPFETEVAVRYSDVDTYGHVNNAVFATFFEEARIDYVAAVMGPDASALLDGGDGVGLVVASLELEFRQPLSLTDAVTVTVAVPEIGTSSFPIEYEVSVDEAVLAVGKTTMVAFDRASHEAVPIPVEWRERLASFAGL